MKKEKKLKNIPLKNIPFKKEIKLGIEKLEERITPTPLFKRKY